MRIEQIAKLAHDVNRSYCEAIGDYSVPSWEESAAEHRHNIIQGVLFQMANPTATPSEVHDNWCAAKHAAGWTWGPVKNIEKKEHNCMVPYSEIPREQRAKDYIFRQLVLSLVNIEKPSTVDHAY